MWRFGSFILVSFLVASFPALLVALTYTSPVTIDGVVESAEPVLGGTSWETDELIDVDGSTNFHFTWDSDKIYFAIQGPYADLEEKPDGYEWFIAVDTDLQAGSGAVSDGYGKVTFSGDHLPEFILYFAGGVGWYETSEWDQNSQSWIWRGWTDSCSYGGWIDNKTSEICIPRAHFGNPTSIAVCSWITDEAQTQVVASYPSANVIGNVPVVMAYFWVVEELTENVAPSGLPVSPTPPEAIVDNERSYPYTCTVMADITPGDCGSSTSMIFYYTADGSDPDTSTSPSVAGTFDACRTGADTTDTYYAIIPAPDEAVVRWIAKGTASNGLVDVSDQIQQFVQGGTAWVGNAGSSPTTCTVWAEIYVGDGGNTTSIMFPYTTDGSDPRTSTSADTATGLFDQKLGNNDKFYAVITDVPTGTTVNWYAFGRDAYGNYAETDTFYTFDQGDTAELYNLNCDPDSNFVTVEIAPKGYGAGALFYWTTDGSDPKTNPDVYQASGFHIEDTDTTGKFSAYLTANLGDTIKWYVHAWAADNSFTTSAVQECVAGATTGPILCNLTCVADSLKLRASISPRGYGAEIRFYATKDGSDPRTSPNRVVLDGSWIADEDDPSGDCPVPVGVFQVELPGQIEVGDTIKWYAHGWYQPHNKYNGLFGDSPVQSCVATTSKAGVIPTDDVGRIEDVKVSPNPFNGTTMISLSLIDPGKVVVSVYDVRGRLVKTLFSGWLESGGRFEWDGRNSDGQTVLAGIYFIRVKTAGQVMMKKAILLR